MKELLKHTNKSEWLFIGIYKVAIYICWFLFACSFNVFLKDSLTDAKLIFLVLSLIVLYGIRVFLKNIYKKNANISYYNLKHSIEMYYFKKLKQLSYKNLEEIDKEELSNKILEVSYNYSRIISDLFEYIIPALIGLFILFIKLLDLNKVFCLIVFFSLIAILLYSYNNIEDEEIKVTNYNDLLKEFISKIMLIKKLNIFNYCVKKLDNTRENDICILKNNDTVSDIKFTSLIFILITVILISSFLFINNTITRLGLIIFFIIIILKLQDLLYKINPAIKNMFISSKNKTILEGGIKTLSPDTMEMTQLLTVCEYYKIDYNRPLKDFTKKELDIILYGSKDKIDFKYISKNGNTRYTSEYYEGIINTNERRHLETSSSWRREWLETFMVESPCPVCSGARLNPSVLAVKINKKNMS